MQLSMLRHVDFSCNIFYNCMSIIPVAQQYTYLLSYSSKVPELELLRDNIQERYQRHRDEANPTGVLLRVYNVHSPIKYPNSDNSTDNSEIVQSRSSD